MHNGIVNRRDKLQADNVNKPVLDTAFVTDNVSEHIVEIIDDHKDDIRNILGGSMLPYSYNEQNTGSTWLDGKKIYQRTHTFTNVVSWSVDTKIPNFDADTIIDVKEKWGDVSGSGWTAPYYYSSQETWIYAISKDGTVSFIRGASRPNVCTVTLLYTKNEEE